MGGKARLHFEHGAGLRSDGAPANFTMAGPDGVFHPATAVIEGETIVVHCDQVTQPRSVRYCWGTTDEGNLFNGAGLSMLTMDIILQIGGQPAYFLDVCGSAEGESLTEALKLLNNDTEV